MAIFEEESSNPKFSFFLTQANSHCQMMYISSVQFLDNFQQKRSERGLRKPCRTFHSAGFWGEIFFKGYSVDDSTLKDILAKIEWALTTDFYENFSTNPGWDAPQPWKDRHFPGADRFCCQERTQGCWHGIFLRCVILLRQNIGTTLPENIYVAWKHMWHATSSNSNPNQVTAEQTYSC